MHYFKNKQGKVRIFDKKKLLKESKFDELLTHYKELYEVEHNKNLKKYYKAEIGVLTILTISLNKGNKFRKLVNRWKNKFPSKKESYILRKAHKFIYRQNKKE